MKNLALATLLGCGSSGGVPRADGNYGACNPNNPKNIRSRCSLAVLINGFQIIIDTSPDFRMQAVQNKIKRVDMLLFTHDHADQCHGIDDVRAFYLRQKQMPIPCFADPFTYHNLLKRFEYFFTPFPFYPSIGRLHCLQGDGQLFLKTNDYSQEQSIFIEPIWVKHGHIQVYGYRIGKLAYIPDVSFISSLSLKKLHGLDILIIDALRLRTHPTHLNLAMALDYIKRLKPKTAVITNMHIDLDYDFMCQTLKSHSNPDTQIVPAFDGMQIDFCANN